MSEATHRDATRPSLILRLRLASDTEAWNTFVEVYGPLIFGRCMRKGLQHEDAEDLTQKIFAKIAHAMRSFQYEPAKGRFRDWLGTVVNGEINRFFRQSSRKTVEVQDPTTLDERAGRSEDATWNEEFNSQVLRCALERCRPHFEDSTWRAFELVWVENKEPTEAAQCLKVPLASIYVAKSRVLKRLWLEVEELAEDAWFL